MKNFNPQADIAPRILATDLDGTLIPLPGNRENQTALQSLRESRERTSFGLIFATGRHDASAFEAMDTHQLPVPDWMICDVGTAILQRTRQGFVVYQKFADHLAGQVGSVGRREVENLLSGLSGLELQDPEYQRPFKISYQSKSEDVAALQQSCNQRLQAAGLPFACVGSVDPFLHLGLLDVLPTGVSKAYALLWLATHADFLPDEVVYSGDSGNDLAALVCGFRAIVVANASPGLATEVRNALQDRHLEDRFFHASAQATSGVLEGCRHFGLLPR